ncbi:MAG: hypothetical protein ACYDBJ_17550 [Aggregatilineales bacterium]
MRKPNELNRYVAKIVRSRGAEKQPTDTLAEIVMAMGQWANGGYVEMDFRAADTLLMKAYTLQHEEPATVESDRQIAEIKSSYRQIIDNRNLTTRTG